MLTVEKFKTLITSKNLFAAKERLLLAVSGGVDSVVLCELCNQANYDFAIAHCNFQLRGEESERDEQFVKKLGKKYGKEVLVKKFDTEKYAADHKLSIQEAARDLRYSWFKELAEGLEPRAVSLEPKALSQNPGAASQTLLLTAHHKDDNIETLLMNFFRGTGLHGLTGIPEKTGYIRRPLLSFSKDELIVFANERKLDFVEDSSNQSSKYTRNFFRNEIIPLISRTYPQVKENLGDNISRFKEIEKLYKFSVGAIKRKLCKKKGKEIHIPIKQLMGYENRALIYEIIAGHGFSERQVDELIKLSESDSGKYIQSDNFRIIRDRHWFIICPLSSTESENIIIESSDREISFALGKLRIEETRNQKPETRNDIACLDLKSIAFPLLLRRWKQGDYFYPLGMKKKKKLSRFFIDQKLSKTDKEKIWVIESNKRILWVVGHRIDERFKITEKTREVLRFILLAK